MKQKHNDLLQGSRAMQHSSHMVGKFLPVLWRNANMQNYKCPEIFWWCVRIEMFPFPDKIPQLQWKSEKWIFNEVVFQVIDIFSRKQTPSQEFCLMKGLIFSRSVQHARRRKEFLPESYSLPKQIKMQSWNSVLKSSTILVEVPAFPSSYAHPVCIDLPGTWANRTFCNADLARLSFVSLADELMPSPSNYQVVLSYVMKV